MPAPESWTIQDPGVVEGRRLFEKAESCEAWAVEERLGSLNRLTQMVTFTNCVKVDDWTPLEVNSREHKYYCPQVSSQVPTEEASGKRSELTNIDVP